MTLWFLAMGTQEGPTQSAFWKTEKSRRLCQVSGATFLHTWLQVTPVPEDGRCLVSSQPWLGGALSSAERFTTSKKGLKTRAVS